MSQEHELHTTTDDLQTLENVLHDTPTAAQTRKGLLKTAAIGAAAAGILGPAGSALASGKRGSADSLDTVVTTAITAEALAVSVLSAAVKAVPGTPAGAFTPVLKAANTSEYLHYAALGTLGGKPLTTKFWVPNAALGPKNVNLFKTIEVAETLFINAYLIGITAAAQAKAKPAVIRYMAEILGVEAEHRVLARYARSQIEKQMMHQVPNNKGFETYSIFSMADIVKALEKAGFGFGKQGAAPGQFVTFPGDPRKNGTGSKILAPTPA
jgi:hypothetical protein